MNLVNTDVESMKDIARKSIAFHKELVLQFEQNSLDELVVAAKIIVECFKNGGTLYLCGNGGSAADAQHVAGEFVGRFKLDRAPLPAVAFSTDTSVLTCIGNDYSYEDIFKRQADALVKKDDVLWVFSTSGSSSNVLKAVEIARQREARVISFTGRSDSVIEQNSDVCICAVSPQTGHAQEIHELAYHIICDFVEQSIFNK